MDTLGIFDHQPIIAQNITIRDVSIFIFLVATQALLYFSISLQRHLDLSTYRNAVPRDGDGKGASQVRCYKDKVNTRHQSTIYNPFSSGISYKSYMHILNPGVMTRDNTDPMHWDMKPLFLHGV